MDLYSESKRYKNHMQVCKGILNKMKVLLSFSDLPDDSAYYRRQSFEELNSITRNLLELKIDSVTALKQNKLMKHTAEKEIQINDNKTVLKTTEINETRTEQFIDCKCEFKGENEVRENNNDTELLKQTEEEKKREDIASKIELKEYEVQHNATEAGLQPTKEKKREDIARKTKLKEDEENEVQHNGTVAGLQPTEEKIRDEDLKEKSLDESKLRHELMENNIKADSIHTNDEEIQRNCTKEQCVTQRRKVKHVQKEIKENNTVYDLKQINDKEMKAKRTTEKFITCNKKFRHVIEKEIMANQSETNLKQIEDEEIKAKYTKEHYITHKKKIKNAVKKEMQSENYIQSDIIQTKNIEVTPKCAKEEQIIAHKKKLKHVVEKVIRDTPENNILLDIKQNKDEVLIPEKNAREQSIVHKRKLKHAVDKDMKENPEINTLPDIEQSNDEKMTQKYAKEQSVVHKTRLKLADEADIKENNTVTDFKKTLNEEENAKFAQELKCPLEKVVQENNAKTNLKQTDDEEINEKYIKDQSVIHYKKIRHGRGNKIRESNAEIKLKHNKNGQINGKYSNKSKPEKLKYVEKIEKKYTENLIQTKLGKIKEIDAKDQCIANNLGIVNSNIEVRTLMLQKEVPVKDDHSTEWNEDSLPYNASFMSLALTANELEEIEIKVNKVCDDQSRTDFEKYTILRSVFFKEKVKNLNIENTSICLSPVYWTKNLNCSKTNSLSLNTNELPKLQFPVNRYTFGSTSFIAMPLGVKSKKKFYEDSNDDSISSSNNYRHTGVNTNEKLIYKTKLSDVDTDSDRRPYHPSTDSLPFDSKDDYNDHRNSYKSKAPPFDSEDDSYDHRNSYKSKPFDSEDDSYYHRNSYKSKALPFDSEDDSYDHRNSYKSKPFDSEDDSYDHRNSYKSKPFDSEDDSYDHRNSYKSKALPFDSEDVSYDHRNSYKSKPFDSEDDSYDHRNSYKSKPFDSEEDSYDHRNSYKSKALPFDSEDDSYDHRNSYKSKPFDFEDDSYDHRNSYKSKPFDSEDDSYDHRNSYKSKPFDSEEDSYDHRNSYKSKALPFDSEDNSYDHRNSYKSKPFDSEDDSYDHRNSYKSKTPSTKSYTLPYEPSLSSLPLDGGNAYGFNNDIDDLVICPNNTIKICKANNNCCKQKLNLPRNSRFSIFRRSTKPSEDSSSSRFSMFSGRNSKRSTVSNSSKSSRFSFFRRRSSAEPSAYDNVMNQFVEDIGNLPVEYCGNDQLQPCGTPKIVPCKEDQNSCPANLVPRNSPKYVPCEKKTKNKTANLVPSEKKTKNKTANLVPCEEEIITTRKIIKYLPSDKGTTSCDSSKYIECENGIPCKSLTWRRDNMPCKSSPKNCENTKIPRKIPCVDDDVTLNSKKYVTCADTKEEVPCNYSKYTRNRLYEDNNKSCNNDRNTSKITRPNIICNNKSSQCENEIENNVCKIETPITETQSKKLINEARNDCGNISEIIIKICPEDFDTDGKQKHLCESCENEKYTYESGNRQEIVIKICPEDFETSEFATNNVKEKKCTDTNKPKKSGNKQETVTKICPEDCKDESTKHICDTNKPKKYISSDTKENIGKSCEIEKCSRESGNKQETVTKICPEDCKDESTKHICDTNKPKKYISSDTKENIGKSCEIEKCSRESGNRQETVTKICPEDCKDESTKHICDTNKPKKYISSDTKENIGKSCEIEKCSRESGNRQETVTEDSKDESTKHICDTNKPTKYEISENGRNELCNIGESPKFDFGQEDDCEKGPKECNLKGHTKSTCVIIYVNEKKKISRDLSYSCVPYKCNNNSYMVYENYNYPRCPLFMNDRNKICEPHIAPPLHACSSDCQIQPIHDDRTKCEKLEYSKYPFHITHAPCSNMPTSQNISGGEPKHTSGSTAYDSCNDECEDDDILSCDSDCVEDIISYQASNENSYILYENFEFEDERKRIEDTSVETGCCTCCTAPGEEEIVVETVFREVTKEKHVKNIAINTRILKACDPYMCPQDDPEMCDVVEFKCLGWDDPYAARYGCAAKGLNSKERCYDPERCTLSGSKKPKIGKGGKTRSCCSAQIEPTPKKNEPVLPCHTPPPPCGAPYAPFCATCSPPPDPCCVPCETQDDNTVIVIHLPPNTAGYPYAQNMLPTSPSGQNYSMMTPITPQPMYPIMPPIMPTNSNSTQQPNYLMGSMGMPFTSNNSSPRYNYDDMNFPPQNSYWPRYR